MGFEDLYGTGVPVRRGRPFGLISQGHSVIGFDGSRFAFGRLKARPRTASLERSGMFRVALAPTAALFSYQIDHISTEYVFVQLVHQRLLGSDAAWGSVRARATDHRRAGQACFSRTFPGGSPGGTVGLNRQPRTGFNDFSPARPGGARSWPSCLPHTAAGREARSAAPRSCRSSCAPPRRPTP